MKSSIYGEVIVEEKDLFESLYNGMNVNLANCKFENSEVVKQFNQAILDNADSIIKLSTYENPKVSQTEFDEQNQANWFMTENYRTFDIASWLLDQCKNQTQIDRVTTELELYFQHDMIEVLNYLKYLVDFMREHNIVWGLGRGSSIASYCLYLIGVHKVDSIKYQLDINEFLK
jgi:DNA polymerase III alpha subunit